MAMNSLLVYAGGKRILIETGAGDKHNDKFRDIYALEGPTLHRQASATTGTIPTTSTSSSTRICISTIAAATRAS